METEEDEYVVSGALISCNQGSMPGIFRASPRTTKVSGAVVANELDKAPLVNIPSFGICKKLTQAAGGTPVPCVPACPAWQKTYPATVAGARPLLKMSCTQCTTGQGKVEFMSSGQIPLSAGSLRDLATAQKQTQDAFKQAELERKSVGETGFVEGLVPVWGPGRDFVHSAQTRDGWGMLMNGGFFIWDAASVALGVISFGTATVAMTAGKVTVRTALKAGTEVAIGLARKEAAHLLARSLALKASFREGLAAARAAAKTVCVRACFAAETPVITRTGSKPIAKITVGEEVWAWSEETHQSAWKAVTEVFRTDTPEMAELNFGTTQLRLTPAHWLFTKPGGWIAAGDLRPGQHVQTKERGLVALLSTHIQVRVETVYNLDVADFHTYFAGFDELLAHNKCDVLTQLVDIGNGVLKKRLKPNISYVRKGYRYTTDAYGRIVKVSGDLHIEPKATRERTQRPSAAKYMQGRAGKNDGRVVGDAGGHLIGDQFGGIGNNTNLVAMGAGVNAYPKGKWGAMEKKWAEALEQGKSVKIDIQPIYKDGSARPHSFKVTQWIDGVKARRTINNL